jgi:hypothetical protein
MEGFSQKKHWEMTQEHLGKMKDEIAEGTPLRDELLDEIGTIKDKDAKKDSKENGPNWRARSRSVDQVRRGMLEDIRLSVRLMAEEKAACTEEAVEKLLAEVKTVRSIENDMDAMAMEDILEKLLDDLKKENV